MTFNCVRGPKTRKHLIERGYNDIPEVYCDPGVLVPYFYQNVISDMKEFDVGIFPHNTENVNWHLNNIRSHDYGKVMIINHTDQIDRVVHNMSRCKRIISSSLHGIIVAEALGIPVSRFRLSDANDPFKFYDYFEGTNRTDVNCNDIRGYHPTSVNMTKFENIMPGKFDIKGLLDSCPFEIEPDLKKDILKYYEKKD